MPTTIGRDLRHALRSLRKRPGYAAAAILVLAVGVGGGSGIFSVVNGVLLRPYPYPDAGELAVIWASEPERGRERMRVAGPNFLDWRDRSTSFEALAAVGGISYVLGGRADGAPERISGGRVTAGYFRLLGIEPALGRTFSPEQNRGEHRVVLLSHALWSGRFGADPGIVGRSVTLDGRSFRVIGVMPPRPFPLPGSGLRLSGPGDRLLWVPLDFEHPWVGRRSSHTLMALGRLRDGVGIDVAGEEMAGIARALREEHPRANEGLGVRVVSFRDEVVGDVRHDLLLLMVAVALVLAVACCNLANLVLARELTREREMSVRAALGAGRGRLLRHVVLELLVLGAVGGLLGVLVAGRLTAALVALAPEELPRRAGIGIDLPVLLFSLGLVVLVSLAVGVIPGLRSGGPEPARALREGGRGRSDGRRRHRTTRALVVSQVVLAVVLLAGAGLLVRSLRALHRVDPGFDPDGVLATELALPPGEYDTPGAIRSFHREVLRDVRGLPGVASAVLAYDPPTRTTWFGSFRIEGRPAPGPGELPDARIRIVGAGYFEAMRIAVQRGRGFRETDLAASPGVAVVNRAFVRRHLPGEEALGAGIAYGTPSRNWGEAVPGTFRIVGVVDDVRFAGPRDPTPPALYLPAAQFPFWGMELLVRTAGQPASLVGPIRGAVRRADPRLPVPEPAPVSDLLAGRLAQERFDALLLAVFAGVALLLSAAGIHGLVSHAVARRRSEMGIRLVLGAEPRDVLGRMVAEAVRLAGVGVGLGLLGAVAAGRLLSGILFGVSTYDPLVLGATAGALLATALVAGYLPARRAARTDPAAALRRE